MLTMSNSGLSIILTDMCKEPITVYHAVDSADTLVSSRSHTVKLSTRDIDRWGEEYYVAYLAIQLQRGLI